jgi:hypothetical protein
MVTAAKPNGKSHMAVFLAARRRYGKKNPTTEAGVILRIILVGIAVSAACRSQGDTSRGRCCLNVHARQQGAYRG